MGCLAVTAQQASVLSPEKLPSGKNTKRFRSKLRTLVSSLPKAYKLMLQSGLMSLLKLLLQEQSAVNLVLTSAKAFAGPVRHNLDMLAPSNWQLGSDSHAFEIEAANRLYYDPGKVHIIIRSHLDQHVWDGFGKASAARPAVQAEGSVISLKGGG